MWYKPREQPGGNQLQIQALSPNQLCEPPFQVADRADALGRARADPTSGSHQRLQPSSSLLKDSAVQSRPVPCPREALSQYTHQEQPPPTLQAWPGATVSLETETGITCLDKLNDNHLESLFLKELKGQCLLFSGHGLWACGGMSRKNSKIQSRTSNSAESGFSHIRQTCLACDQTGAGCEERPWQGAAAGRS